MTVRLELLALYVSAVLLGAVCLKCCEMISWLFHTCMLSMGQSFHESHNFDVQLINILSNPGLSAAVWVGAL